MLSVVHLSSNPCVHLRMLVPPCRHGQAHASNRHIRAAAAILFLGLDSAESGHCRASACTLSCRPLWQSHCPQVLPYHGKCMHDLVESATIDSAAAPRSPHTVACTVFIVPCCLCAGSSGRRCSSSACGGVTGTVLSTCCIAAA